MITTSFIIEMIFNLIVFGILIAASVSDIKTRIVPVKYQYALLITSALHLISLLFVEDGWKMALNCLLSGIFTFVVYIVLVLTSKKGNSIGGADTKVTSLMASFLGWQQTLCFIFAHAIAAMIYTLYMFIVKRIMVKSVPLMPFLAIGYVVAKVLYYINYFGLLQI